MDYLVISAFIAGLLTFLAPCTLPLVPGYLGFISGISLADLQDKKKSKKVRWKIILNGLFFVTGFSVVFIIFGTAAGLIGNSLIQHKLWLGRIGGIFVVIFGLFMMNIIKIPALNKERKFKIPFIFERGKPLNSFILGTVFAFGWTPCIGPILGSILTLATVSATVGQGAFLLFIFSLGLALPFMIIAILISWAVKYLKKLSSLLNIISVIGGLFLVFLGILLITDSLSIWVTFFFKIFNFMNYDSLLDYL